MKFALVDCNAFYVSCERVFRPDLEDKPVVILSNNDGAVVARDPRAKALGIAMSQPYFEIKHLVDKTGLVALSSNYALYGDMSARVMSILTDAAPRAEVYSIDESFLEIDGIASILDRTAYAHDLRRRVRQWTGIPVSIGIGPTKTLAKVANRIAKKAEKTAGVLDLSDRPDWTEKALKRTDVNDVWGIGRQWARACQSAGITNAFDLANANTAWVKTTMGKVGLRTVLELRGTAVHTLETEPADRKTVCVSRSFGKAVTSAKDVRDALLAYTSHAAAKLRHDNLLAAGVQVILTTDQHRPEDPQRSVSATACISPSSDTTALARVALSLLDRLWQPGYRYRKTGVLLVDLIQPENMPADLFTPRPSAQQNRLMTALDAANARFGADTVHLGLSAPAAPWRMRQDAKTPAWTTNWAEVPIVSIDGLTPRP